MLEKETALILPGLLFAYEWIWGREGGSALEVRRILTWSGGALAKIWPYFLVVALYVPARIHARHGFNDPVTPPGAGQLVLTCRCWCGSGSTI